MELSTILSIGVSSLILIVLTHFAVFWVVRTLYPPAPNVVPVYVQAPQTQTQPVAQSVFTQPPIQEQPQVVNVPTYENTLQLEASNQEGATNISSFLSGPPAGGDSGLVATHA